MLSAKKVNGPQEGQYEKKKGGSQEMAVMVCR